jgi:hypothetical protein
MTTRFAWVMLALIVVSALLTACSTESRDTAEKYINAVMKGNDEEALTLSCDSYDETTKVLLEWHKEKNIQPQTIDLKYDIGKGNNQKEIIVTGSFKYGAEDPSREYEISEKLGTRIVLMMGKQDGDWCVTDKSEFEGVSLASTTE